MAVSRDPAFRTVRMRESYDLDAVDDFVDRVIDAMEGRPAGRSLTPERIEGQEFKVVRFREGYSMDDVDDWLDAAAAELRRMRTADDRHPQLRQEPSRAEPSYEQVGVPATGSIAMPPAAPPPVTPPVPPAMTPPPAAPPAAFPNAAPPQYPHDSGFFPPQQTDAGLRPVDTGYHQQGLDTAFHQLDPALQQLDPSHGQAPGGGPHVDQPAGQVTTPTTGLHHLEIWVRDLELSVQSFGWLFERLGWQLFQAWDNGRSWQAPNDGPYIVVERSPDLTWSAYDRKTPGLNHLALAVPERWMVDRIVSEAATYGWRLLFADRHPYAGGSQHYAAYLENEEGFEVEVVAQ